MTATPEFDPVRLIATLVEHDVRFIVIGGLAGNVHGSALATFDLDVCYERSDDNLAALARALVALHARLRGVPPDLPFSLDARTLKNVDSFTFETDAGSLDCLGTPAGTTGYTELARHAMERHVAGARVYVASLDDLMRMKRAAGRTKDLLALEILGALRDEIDGVPE
jgi:hypothetical protein